MEILFKQSRDIKEFRPLINTLIPDFDYVFLHTILQWCNLANDPYEGQNKFWEVWLIGYEENNNWNTIGICGLYSLVPHKTDKLWLGWLAIIPELRNKGLGKKVMDHLYREALYVGCAEIYSYVDKEGAPLNFYKREKFEILGTVQEFLDSNNLSKIDGNDFEDPNDYVIRKVISY